MEGDVNELLVTLKWAQSLTKQFKRGLNRRMNNTLKRVTKETLRSVRKFCYDFDTFLNKSDDDMSETEGEGDEEEDEEVEEEEKDEIDEGDNGEEDRNMADIVTKNSVMGTTSTWKFLSLSSPDKAVVARLVELGKELKKVVSAKKTDHEKGFKVLQDIANMTITPAVLKKTGFIISTLRKVKTSNLNPILVDKAEQLYYRLTGRFEVGFSQPSSEQPRPSTPPVTRLSNPSTAAAELSKVYTNQPPEYSTTGRSCDVTVIDLCTPSPRPSNTVSEDILMDDDLDDCFIQVDLEEMMTPTKLSHSPLPQQNLSDSIDQGDEEEVSATPKVSPLCRCDLPSKRVLSKTAKNPNRWFYKCDECNYFKWESDVSAVLTIQGPKCECGQPSIQRYVNSILVWVCANPNASTSCKWKRNCDDIIASQVPAVGNGTVDSPGDVEFLVSGPERSKLEKLFRIPPNTPLQIQHTTRTLNYDDLQVEVAWKVVNQVNLNRFTDHDRSSYINTHSPIDFSSDYQTAVRSLLSKQPLDASVNEVLLLHATSPKNVYPILFEGLDAGLARGGLYGRGIYFSDEGAKINQYARIDEKDRTSNDNHRLQKLHRKLYGGLVSHPNDVYYALVCRVALGKNVVIKGKSEIPFKNQDKNSLKDGCNSLQVARTNTQLHREFVVFDSSDVHIEYLVAFKRRRAYCLCGVEGTVRNVSKRTVNHGRPFFFCGLKPERCDEKLMFPLCDCGATAWVTFRDDDVTKYGCGKYSGCKFQKEYRSVSKGSDLWRLEDTRPAFSAYHDHYECCCC